MVGASDDVGGVVTAACGAVVAGDSLRSIRYSRVGFA